MKEQALQTQAQLTEGWSNEADADYPHAPASAVEAWKDRKFGMRIHWGPYSVLGLDASWPSFGASREFQEVYSTLYQVFNPADFDASEWAELAQRAGMTYFVFTTRHCDGFSMFDTRTEVDSIRRRPGNNSAAGIGRTERCRIHYSTMDTPYPVDIVGSLAQAFRKRDMGVGLYYSWADWHDPDSRSEKHNMFYDPILNEESNSERLIRFAARVREQVREISSNYGDLFEISFDTSLPESLWPETVNIVKMARELQPFALFRDPGIGPYGDFTKSEDRAAPGPMNNPPLGKPWEAIEPLGSRWAYQPNDVYKSKEWLLETLIDVVSKGGNFMPGVSPMANGRFPQEMIDRLEYAGTWLRVNGEAIYKTRQWDIFKEGESFRFTQSADGKYLYAIALKWPGKTVALRSVRPIEGSQIAMLGTKHNLQWRLGDQGLIIDIPQAIEQLKPCEQAYVFKIQAHPLRLDLGSSGA